MKEILWTLPLELPTGDIPSLPKRITNEPYDKLQVGFGSREEHFGICVPHEVVLRTPDGAVFRLERLTVNPDGKGDLVPCWIRTH